MSTKTEYSCNFKTTARKLSRIKINDILNKADEANETMITESIPKFRTDLKAPDIVSDENKKDSEDNSILMLKSSLEALVVQDPELKEYYDGLETRLNKKKIDEIYSIVTTNIPYEHPKINFRKSSTSRYTLKENKHLSPKKESSDSPSFIQATFTDSPDETESENVDLTTFNDSDMDAISQKIHDGDLKIQNDETDPSQLTFDMIEEEKKKELEDDLNLKIAFDMINADDEENIEESHEDSETVFSKLFKYRVFNDDEVNESSPSIKEEEYDGYECNSNKDYSEAETLLKNALSVATKKFILSFGIFLLFAIIKILSVKYSVFAEYISYPKYGVIYILGELQLLFASIAINKGSFINGLKTFTTGKFTSSSIFSITAIFTTIHSIFSIFNQEQGIILFNSIALMMSLFLSLSTYFKCKKNLTSFYIVSKDEEKFVASELSPASKEASNFYSYLLEDSDVYTVSRTKFVSSFFKRISKNPKSEDILVAIIPGVFFVSAIIFAICFFYGKMNVYTSFTASTAFFCTALPASSFFTITVPLFAANNACLKIDSTIIGETVAEEYANASVISFEDKELFPSSRVTMTNMKVYHNMRIDQIIVELARLFSHLGGPLKDLFSQSVDGVFEEHSVIKIIESAENGIMIAADGVDYYLGNGEFMRSHGLSYEDEESDLSYEKNGGSVMIFGANTVVAAKFYFKYLPQKGFKKLLSHMYKCGLCIGIKTLDPNINNNLLSYHADDSECPISILKSSDPSEINSVFDKVDSGIVSNRSLGAFLKAFMLCDKARHSIKSNGFIMISGVILTGIMAIFLSITGGITNFSPTHALLFQTLWSFAVFILSFLK